MRKIVTFAFATALAAGSLSGVASAQNSRSGQVSVTVIVIKQPMDSDDYTQQVPRRYLYPSAQTIAQAQDEIRSDAYLRDYLLRKRVQLRNVVGVQTAFSGGKIVYVR